MEEYEMDQLGIWILISALVGFCSGVLFMCFLIGVRKNREGSCVVTFVLRPGAQSLLDELSVFFGKAGHAEVFDLAITMLEWARKETKERRTVGSLSDFPEASFRELKLPTPYDDSKSFFVYYGSDKIH